MITTTVWYLAHINALHLDSTTAKGRAHQGIREAREDPASSGKQGSVELVPGLGRAAAPGAEHAQAGREETKTERRRRVPNAQESHR